jgi:hypothetical protein
MRNNPRCPNGTRLRGDGFCIAYVLADGDARLLSIPVLDGILTTSNRR